MSHRLLCCCLKVSLLLQAPPGQGLPVQVERFPTALRAWGPGAPALGQALLQSSWSFLGAGCKASSSCKGEASALQ